MPRKKQRFCLRGHDTAITGRYSSGSCRVCSLEAVKIRTANKIAPLSSHCRRGHPYAGELSCKVCQRQITRQKRTGCSPELYQQLLTDQNGLCAICRGPERDLTKAGKRKSLAADHDHISGAVRGLLCGRCNLLLGRAQESVPLLQQAIDYLQNGGGSSSCDILKA